MDWPSASQADCTPAGSLVQRYVSLNTNVAVEKSLIYRGERIGAGRGTLEKPDQIESVVWPARRRCVIDSQSRDDHRDIVMLPADKNGAVLAQDFSCDATLAAYREPGIEPDTASQGQRSHRLLRSPKITK